MPSIITGHTICCNMFTSNIHLNQKVLYPYLGTKNLFIISYKLLFYYFHQQPYSLFYYNFS